MKEIIRPQRCENCKHFMRKDAEMGECRAHTPHIATFLTQPPPNSQRPGNINVTVFPQVQLTQWCGEHALRLDS